MSLPEPQARTLGALRTVLERRERLVVAFSGGADSSLLARVATDVLGTEQVICATAVSPSFAPEDLAETRALAAEWGLQYREVESHEFDNPAYTANDLERCYYCKAELLDVLGPLARASGGAVALGVNRDDLSDHRPGQGAALERGAVFPLVEANLTKDAVRELSRVLGLRTWDKPANACLSSRVPQGTPISLGLMSQVARAESVLRKMGFRELRVRHYGDTARIELAESDLGRAVAQRSEIVAALREVGYRYVTLDLDGFRSGNLVRSAIAAQHTEG